MLEFIYLDQVTHDPEITVDLLELADKYSLFQLVVDCGEYLLNKVTLENVIRITQLAERIGLKELQQKTVEVMKENIDSLLKVMNINKIS